MEKATTTFNQGQGNLQAIFYGYSKGTEDALDEIGNRFIEIIHEEFSRSGTIWGGWEKLHEFTIQMKGTSVPLISTSDFRDSFRYEKVSSTMLWIGSDSKIAPIHQFGVTITVTDKMRNYLAALGFHVKASTVYITIPERPVFRPALEQLKKEFGKIIINSILGNIKIKAVG